MFTYFLCLILLDDHLDRRNSGFRHIIANSIEGVRRMKGTISGTISGPEVITNGRLDQESGYEKSERNSEIN